MIHETHIVDTNCLTISAYAIRSIEYTLRVTTPVPPCTPCVMGRPQFDERIQLTLVDGTTVRIDDLLEAGEYRLDFIRTTIAKRLQEKPLLATLLPGRLRGNANPHIRGSSPRCVEAMPT